MKIGKTPITFGLCLGFLVLFGMLSGLCLVFLDARADVAVEEQKDASVRVLQNRLAFVGTWGEQNPNPNNLNMLFKLDEGSMTMWYEGDTSSQKWNARYVESSKTGPTYDRYGRLLIEASWSGRVWLLNDQGHDRIEYALDASFGKLYLTSNAGTCELVRR